MEARGIGLDLLLSVILIFDHDVCVVLNLHQRVVLDLDDGVAGAGDANVRLVAVILQVPRLIIDLLLGNILDLHSQTVARLLWLIVLVYRLVHIVLNYLLATFFQRLQLILDLIFQVLLLLIFELVIKK